MIEGVCVSGIWNMPPGEALQEKVGVSFETKDCLQTLHFPGPLRALCYHLVWAQMTTIFPGLCVSIKYRLVKVSIGLES